MQLLSNRTHLEATRARVISADLTSLHNTTEAAAYVPLFKWLAHSDKVPCPHEARSPAHSA